MSNRAAMVVFGCAGLLLCALADATLAAGLKATAAATAILGGVAIGLFAVVGIDEVGR